MKEQLSFLILITVILFFTQCKNTETTSQASDKAVVSPTEKPVIATTETPQKKDTIPLKTSKASEIIIPQQEAKEASLVKKVETKTAESNDRKKEPIAPKKKKKRAKMKFEKDIFEFGKIKQGDKVTYDFKFKNTGDAPLVIKNVDVSCGCTFPSYPFIPIQPGEEGVIGVIFNSEHKVGRQKPTVTVITNARPRTHKLYLKGFVE